MDNDLGGQTQTFKPNQVRDLIQIHPSCLKGVEDMVTLGDLHEAGLMHTLRIRYLRDEIYTYTGAILVSVNPYQMLPIYTPEKIKEYRGQLIGALPPHLFAIADNAFSDMSERGASQSVIISGESGAGKTEATKVILQYLTAISGNHSWVEQQILDSSPILEAFGNAKTLRNDNSSRFGKFMQVHFSRDNQIIGASIENYLLEKSRIVHQAEGERNYHIFYQICKGAPAEDRKKYNILTCKDYDFLNHSGVIDIDHVDDKDDFNKVKMAMEVLGFTEEEIDAIHRILSGVLMCGNIFHESLADGEKCKLKDESIPELAADIFLVDKPRFKTCFLERTLKTGKETFKVAHKFTEARPAVLAFCKTLYTKMFDWIVKRINDSICKTTPDRFIGVLDIFGFEIFKQNLFEQFCINFANEKLQQHFNHFIFKVEQEEYNKERIDWSTIEFVDNQECLDLVEKKPVGIIQLIDEQCRAPKATDKTLVEKLHKTYEKHAYYEAPKRNQMTFIIKHYAGEVAYDIVGFLEKNSDTLYQDFSDVMKTSKSKTLVSLFAENNAASKDSGKAEAGKQTVASFFKEQLQSLLNVLNSTSPHFVRCIKPNTVKKPRVFEAPFILRQLRYAGMMEAVRIRRMGFPIRRLPREFYLRYRCLHDPGAVEKNNEKDLCKKICTALDLSPAEHQFGLTKVFLREQTHQRLEDMRMSKWKDMVLVIQAFCKMTRDRSFFREVAQSAIQTQRICRGFLGRTAVVNDWHARDKQIQQKNSALLESEDKYCKALFAIIKKIEQDREQLNRDLLKQEDAYMHNLMFETKKQDLIRQNREKTARRAEEKYQRSVEAALLKEEMEKLAREADEAARAAADKQRKLEEEAAAANLPPPPPPPPPVTVAATKLEAAKKKQAKLEEEAKKAESAAAAAPDTDDLDAILAALEGEKRELESTLQKVGEDFAGGSTDASGKNMVGAQVKALFDFTAVDDSQLNMKTDDVIVIVQMDDSGWARGELNGQVGWFPFDFVEVIAEAPQGGDSGGPQEPILPGSIVKALFDFDGMDESQLTLKKDDLIIVLESDESGWCQGKMSSDGRKGWYPADYVVLVETASVATQDKSAAGPGVLHAALSIKDEVAAAGQSSSSSLALLTGMADSTEKDTGSIFVEGSATVPLPADIHKYTMEDLARKNFAEVKTGTFRKRAVDALDMIVWSKEPIKQPLFRIEKPEMQQEAIQVFHSIMKYMGDYASKRDNILLIKHIISVGVAMPELRDEIYVQFCKQITNNMNKESVLKGWELFSFVTGIFAPTKVSENHMRNFFKKSTRLAGQIGEYAGYCSRMVARTLTNGSRLQVPSDMEIEALKAHRPIILRVHFLDGTSKGIAVESQTTVKEVVRHMTRKMGIKYQSAFALYEQSAAGSASVQPYEKLLKGDEHVLDIVAEFGINEITDGRFVFKNRLYFKQFETLQDEGLNNMLYIQTVALVLSGAYLITTDEAVELAALQMHIQNQGQKPQNTSFIKEHPEVLIPKQIVKSQEGSSWEKAITSRYQSISSLTVEQAKTKYLQALQKKPYFGQTFYDVEQTVAVGNIPTRFILGISSEGVHFLNTSNLEQYAFYPYAAVANWGFSSSTFVVITGDMRRQTKFLLRTRYGSEISSLVQTYISQVSP